MAKSTEMACFWTKIPQNWIWALGSRSHGRCGSNAMLAAPQKPIFFFFFFFGGGGGGVTPPGAFVGGSRAVLCVGPNPCPRQLLVVVLCRMPCHATRRRQLHRIKVLPQGERLGCPCRWPPTSIPNPCCFHIDIDICVCMMLRSVTCSGIQCSHSISNYISIYRMCNMNRI